MEEGVDRVRHVINLTLATESDYCQTMVVMLMKMPHFQGI